MNEPLHRDKPHEWMADAACHGSPTELWFPPRGANAVPAGDVAIAKATCAACPVRQECLDYSLMEPVERIGIWGGLTVGERQRYAGRRIR